MSTEFNKIGNIDSQTDNDDIRSAAVESALVLINSGLSISSSPSNLINHFISDDVISKLADSIEKALKNTN